MDGWNNLSNDLMLDDVSMYVCISRLKKIGMCIKTKICRMDNRLNLIAQSN